MLISAHLRLGEGGDEEALDAFVVGDEKSLHLFIHEQRLDHCILCYSI